jgi:hypothetical protein
MFRPTNSAAGLLAGFTQTSGICCLPSNNTTEPHPLRLGSSGHGGPPGLAAMTQHLQGTRRSSLHLTPSHALLQCASKAPLRTRCSCQSQQSSRQPVAHHTARCADICKLPIVAHLLSAMGAQAQRFLPISSTSADDVCIR